MQDCRARVTWGMRSPKNLHIRQDKDKCLLKKKWPHGRQKAAPPCDIKQTPLRLSKKWLWLALVFSNNCASEQDKQEIYIKQIFQHNMTLYSVVARWRTCWDLIDVIWLYCVSRREFFLVILLRHSSPVQTAASGISLPVHPHPDCDWLSHEN